MTDQPSSSGSRWEPTESTSPTHEPTDRTNSPLPAAAEPAYVAAPTTRRPRRGRAIIAGAALGLLGLGGIGGYAVGAATADDDGDRTRITDAQFSDGDGDGRFGGPRDGLLPPGPGDQPGDRPDRFGDPSDDLGEGVEPGSNT